jgi:hypothetical protein
MLNIFSKIYSVFVKIVPDRDLDIFLMDPDPWNHVSGPGNQFITDPPDPEHCSLPFIAVFYTLSSSKSLPLSANRGNGMEPRKYVSQR